MVVPSITTRGMDSGMARFAKSNQIFSCVCTTFRKRDAMVDFLSRNKQTFLLAQLTQRMRRSIAVTDSLPCSAVLLVYVRTAFVFVVLPAGGRFMLLAVLPVREVGTAGVGTWALWFLWHRCTSLGHKKSPHRIAPMKAVLYSTSLL